MPALRDLQRALGAALLDGALLDGAVNDAAAEPALLDVYRNTCLGVLSHALSLAFPAVQRLVGSGFFETAAQQFIRAHPPSSACLNDYGQEFAAFLERYPHAASLPYLADVARLEWAVNCALHAADAAPLDLASLAGLDAALMPLVKFVPHPSVTVLRLDTPADAIWRAVLDEDDAAMRAIDTAAGPVWLLIERSALGVQVRRMQEAAWRFTRRLCAGEPLQAALDGEGFDALLADHLSSGRFVGFTP